MQINMVGIHLMWNSGEIILFPTAQQIFTLAIHCTISCRHISILRALARAYESLFAESSHSAAVMLGRLESWGVWQLSPFLPGWVGRTLGNWLHHVVQLFNISSWWHGIRPRKTHLALLWWYTNQTSIRKSMKVLRIILTCTETRSIGFTINLIELNKQLSLE